MAKTEKNTKTNAPIQEEVQTIIEAHYKDLNGKSLKELLDIKDALTYLVQYYDNYAQANSGNYQYDTKEAYENAKNQSLKYGKALAHLIQEIKHKVESEIYQ